MPNEPDHTPAAAPVKVTPQRAAGAAILAFEDALPSMSLDDARLAVRYLTATAAGLEAQLDGNAAAAAHLRFMADLLMKPADTEPANDGGA